MTQHFTAEFSIYCSRKSRRISNVATYHHIEQRGRLGTIWRHPWCMRLKPFILNTSVSYISIRPLAQASVKSVGRVQILNHSPVWRVQFSSPRNYLNCKIKNVFALPRKFLNINLPFLFYKVLFSERQVTYYIRLHKWLPSSDNYRTHEM